MKKKIILLLVLSVLALQACTLKVCTPTHINYSTGQQLYSCQSYQKGAAFPVFTVYNMARQMTKR